VASVLIAGIGNIFQGDDAFGVSVVQKVAGIRFPENVRVMDIGIRSLDLAFALLEQFDQVILVDAAARGGLPGTLYTIEISPDDVPHSDEQVGLVNSHALDPVRVLTMAKSMGARFGKIILVACEPLALDHDETGHIGLSDPVAAAVDPAVSILVRLVEEFTQHQKSSDNQKEEEACAHELG